MSIIPKSIQMLSAQQWWWVLCAYGRLVSVQMRIKLKQSAWLQDKLTFSSAKVNNSLVIEASRDSSDGTNSGRTNSGRTHSGRTHSGRTHSDMHESVRIAARFFPGQPACLPRSIVLADMLNRRGYAAQVHIGVNKTSKAMSSHAWVEVDGVMVAEPESVNDQFTHLQKPL